MSSLISNWPPILVTFPFTIWSAAPGSVKTRTLCQSTWDFRAIWQRAPGASPVPVGVLLAGTAGDRAPTRLGPGPAALGAGGRHVGSAPASTSQKRSSAITSSLRPLLGPEPSHRDLGGRRLPTASAKEVGVLLSAPSLSVRPSTEIFL